MPLTPAFPAPPAHAPRVLMLSHVSPGHTDAEAASALRLLQVMARYRRVDLVVAPNHGITLDAWRLAFAQADRLWILPRSRMPWRRPRLPREVLATPYELLFATSHPLWQLGATARARHTIYGGPLTLQTDRAVALLHFQLGSADSTDTAAPAPMLRTAA